VSPAATTVASSVEPLTEEEAADAEDYDPWQPFNEHMFWFNHRVLDRFLMRPLATGWSKLLHVSARRSIERLLVNIEMPKRFANNLLQARPVGASRELARFVINSTAGVAGLFDVASGVGIRPSPADAGGTLAMYGIGAGPYLVLPTMPPLTVRDAIGRAMDGALDPLSYLVPLPLFANRGRSLFTAMNERSLDLKFFAGVEESVLDLYAAARNGYLQRRRMVVRVAKEERAAEWRWALGPAEPVRPVASLLPELSPELDDPT
jgi:phospholipid-binding lipoprotein MlaA